MAPVTLLPTTLLGGKGQEGHFLSGRFIASEPGKLKLTFDNKFSRLRGKKVSFAVTRWAVWGNDREGGKEDGNDVEEADSVASAGAGTEAGDVEEEEVGPAFHID